MKMRFCKMVDFPVSPVVGEEFPKVTETKPGQFGAKYHYWTGRAGGWLMGDTADGSGKRRYPFRVDREMPSRNRKFRRKQREG